MEQLIHIIHHCQLWVIGRSYLSNSLLIFLPFCWHLWGMELSHLGDKPYNSTESIANSWPFFIIKDWKNRSPGVIFQCYISSVLREGSKTLTITVEQWLILWEVRTDSSQTKNISLFRSTGYDGKEMLCVCVCIHQEKRIKGVIKQLNKASAMFVYGSNSFNPFEVFLLWRKKQFLFVNQNLNRFHRPICSAKSWQTKF